MLPALTRLHGPVTQQRMTRLALAYAALFGLAISLLLCGPPALAGVALGLMAPGAGLSLVWAAFSALAFAAALLVWFGTGNVLAPPAVWLGAALAAIGQTPGLGQQMAVPGAIVLGFSLLWLWQKRRLRHAQSRRNAVNAHLTTCPGLPTPTPPADELTPADLARLRLLLDRALQPVTAFEGFDWRDQFQTAAIRYQINFMSYALSMVQAQFTPACKGYLHQAQDNLLKKLQDPRVWRYWRLENLWGNLATSRDPIRRDNIMYAGFLAAQMAWHRNACAYPVADMPRIICGAHSYDLPEIIEILTRQFETSPFGLLPCEPNWVYPLCNLITATAIRAHSVRHRTDHWGRISARLSTGMDTEFLRPDGQLVAFRSSLTGLAGLAAGGAIMQSLPCLFLNAVAPHLALRHWQTLSFAMQGRDWRRAIWRLDVGNYGASRAAGYAATTAAAREIGDDVIADQMLAWLDQDNPAIVANGAAHRENASLWALAVEVMARANRHNGLHDLVSQPQTKDAPYIEVVDHAQTMVAKATNAADRLDAVLYPRRPGQNQTITIAGLRAHGRYGVQGGHAQIIAADAMGKALISLTMTDRTALSLTPIFPEQS